MNQEALARLRRLGVVKGARNLQDATRKGANDERSNSPISMPGQERRRANIDAGEPGEPQPLETLLPGLEVATTVEGACVLVDRVFPLQQRHGAHRLGDLLAQSGACAARMCQDERLAELTFRDCLFLDTETTGLNGAGTLAFMVGVGFFEDDAFVVRQYFLRDPGEEPAMLLLLHELIQAYSALITFNGRSFDVPLLDGRFLMNRLACDLLDRAHIDLLPLARRLWRQRFSSCSLSALEENLLGIERTREDVPGWLIPSLYYQYLQTGDGREIARIFYHNRIDILSMVTLATRIARLFDTPDADDHPLELLGLGKWKAALGYSEEAESALRMAAAPELETEFYQEALLRLGALLKRRDRRDEAVTVWRQAAVTSFDDVTAHVELAKHFEWHASDLEKAMQWTEEALQLVDGSASNIREELEHRLARLQRKTGQSGDHTVT